MKRFMTLIASALIGLALGSSALAQGNTHRVAIHVDQDDKAVMNLALNNVENITKHYEEKGDKIIIEAVAYGPGLNMFIPGKSPVEDRIETMSLALQDVTFSACGNTHRKMSAKAGKDIKIMSEAGMIPSGVVRLIELQEDGYAYLRP
jgi:intracellular sulfur oxidation DsrE/DsrF family protein